MARVMARVTVKVRFRVNITIQVSCARVLSAHRQDSPRTTLPVRRGYTQARATSPVDGDPPRFGFYDASQAPWPRGLRGMTPPKVLVAIDEEAGRTCVPVDDSPARCILHGHQVSWVKRVPAMQTRLRPELRRVHLFLKCVASPKAG